MEAKRWINGRWFQSVVISLVFCLFTAKAEAQLAVVSVSPTGTNVSNGDTVTFNASAYVTVGVLSSVTWSFSGKWWPTNATCTSVQNLLNIDSSINSTLTISNFTPACAGTYTVTVTGGLLGLLGTASQSVTLGVIPTVTGVASGSAMVTKGFKLQFSGPTGSNLVIQASSDLKKWTPICTNVIMGGFVTYTDAMATTVPGRFYRAMLK